MASAEATDNRRAYDYKYFNPTTQHSFAIMDLRFKHPFTCIISGPTGSGKSVFVFKMLDNLPDMITPIPQRVIYFTASISLVLQSILG